MSEHTGRLMALSAAVGGLVTAAALLIPVVFKPAPTTAPQLAPFVSDWLGGGHSPDEICTPLKQQYEKQYPEYNIDVRSFEANPKNSLGHVTYQYHCLFTATPRAR
jgi:hypothetical protein